MLRWLIYGLGILHLGPGIAFGLMAFGCEGEAPPLGTVCSASVFSGFGLLTGACWLTLIAASAAFQLVQRARLEASARTGLRVAALVAVLATGALVGATGTWLTRSQTWFLAVPAALAMAWLFLANPLVCAPPPD
jgi:hypothetical protein